jgi:hypothetical protein
MGYLGANPPTAHLHQEPTTPASKNKLRKPMPVPTERQSSQSRPNAARLYPSGLLPSLQSLLATLAEIDFEHESDIETIRDSSADEWLKQTAIRTLQERHRKRRAPYVRQLTMLQKQIPAAAA